MTTRLDEPGGAEVRDLLQRTTGNLPVLPGLREQVARRTRQRRRRRAAAGVAGAAAVAAVAIALVPGVLSPGETAAPAASNPSSAPVVTQATVPPDPGTLPMLPTALPVPYVRADAGGAATTVVDAAGAHRLSRGQVAGRPFGAGGATYVLVDTGSARELVKLVGGREVTVESGAVSDAIPSPDGTQYLTMAPPDLAGGDGPVTFTVRQAGSDAVVRTRKVPLTGAGTAAQVWAPQGLIGPRAVHSRNERTGYADGVVLDPATLEARTVPVPASRYTMLLPGSGTRWLADPTPDGSGFVVRRIQPDGSALPGLRVRGAQVGLTSDGKHLVSDVEAVDVATGDATATYGVGARNGMELVDAVPGYALLRISRSSATGQSTAVACSVTEANRCFRIPGGSWVLGGKGQVPNLADVVLAETRP